MFFATNTMEDNISNYQFHTLTHTPEEEGVNNQLSVYFRFLLCTVRCPPSCLGLFPSSSPQPIFFSSPGQLSWRPSRSTRSVHLPLHDRSSPGLLSFTLSPVVPVISISSSTDLLLAFGTSPQFYLSSSSLPQPTFSRSSSLYNWSFLLSPPQPVLSGSSSLCLDLPGLLRLINGRSCYRLLSGSSLGLLRFVLTFLVFAL